MKTYFMRVKRAFFLVGIVAISVVFYIQYPKLNIIAGYAAKNMSTNVFYANRSEKNVQNKDHNVPSVKLAKTTVDANLKTATSSVFGALKRTSFFREGLGSVLIDDEFDIDQKFLTPKRTPNTYTLHYPYGTGTPSDSTFANINYKQLKTAINLAFVENDKKFKKNTRAVIALYKDHLIAEQYGENFNKNTPLLGWSMAKSLLATIVGVLDYQKKIDVQKPVVELLNLKNWEKDDRSKITTNHLLKMTSGLAWEEDYTQISDATRMLFLERDMTKTQAYKKLIYAPGSKFNYSSGTSNLISGILRAQFKTQQEYLDFPYTELIDKIGMNSMLFETDMEGNYVGSSYAWATARDWAKLGLLYLHKGNWNGTQIFNKSWADYVAKPTKASNYSYGGHFRTTTLDGFPNVPNDMYFAYGYHGQFTMVIPSMDLVVVRLGLTHEDKKYIYAYADQLIKNILSCIE
jgi:CubicO group peptidase (beta-lactamase class C family)